MKVNWSNNATSHLLAIYEYIAYTSQVYATTTIDRLTKRSTQIASFPMSGRMVPEVEKGQIREIIEGSYRIIYHIGPDQIEVLAVLHGAQDFHWPAA